MNENQTQATDDAFPSFDMTGLPEAMAAKWNRNVSFSEIAEVIIEAHRLGVVKIARPM